MEVAIWSRMIAASGDRSSPPAVGIMRRSGASTGSVRRKRISVKMLAVIGATQDRMTRTKMAMVRNWVSRRMALSRISRKSTLAPQLPGSAVGDGDGLLYQLGEASFIQDFNGGGGSAARRGDHSFKLGQLFAGLSGEGG